MTSAQLFTRWVEEKHRGQLVKKTTAPYFTHLAAVAGMAGPLMALGYETGLCHDLLEDTETTADELTNTLILFGYEPEQASFITSTVTELTDVYTSAAFPFLSKDERKEKEALRLSKTSPAAQTLKYCDLADNIKWVLRHDRKHALQYLQKKERLVKKLTAGDAAVRKNLLTLIRHSISNFGGK
ncbi:hypothetical protein [Mucilaginibacter gotjawali]|uniref:(P)ppGpp synthase/HD superfamily hydrolase n=1 Tax=Mucilaginibacter gotjawali TaxID=1550579 RepID=A0A839S9R6_9SPHI|nr:hypothetical protein [Mucilaginibacter gotjawali]MBB3054871.1 (p)ppGpp synthase/HD superfamily hydrolase [Mucilaginibacter gotjawali]